jgi:membrane-associated protease RseP (regulator of RpoE activity)
VRFSFILSIVVALGTVITIHELGHFILCKVYHVETPLFSLGFGPRIIEKKIGKTTFVIAALPLGGYVQIAGMEGNKDFPGSFAAKPFYQKTLILLGGICFNFLAAYLLFFFLLFHTAWMQAPFTLMTFFHLLTKAWLIFIAAVKQTINNFIVTASSEITSPLRLISFITQNVHSTIEAFLTTLAFMNISIGLFNLLPLPILDGGRFLLIGIETLRGRSFDPITVAYFINTSFFILILTIVLMSIRDISRMR